MTIGANLSLKVRREYAVKFAFLMSIPVILGGFVLETYQFISEGSANIDILPLLIGMVSAGTAGYFAIKLFIRTVVKGKLRLFAWYVFALAALILADQLFFGAVFDRFFG